MASSQQLGSRAHVLHVLTAVFDINSGPTVKHQYPNAIPGDQNLIAELMLPDQSHARKEDWTVFFLYNQHDNSSLEYYISSIDDRLKATKLYVLNLVNTKFTKDVKRGAIVKAMCIVTPHPFFHVFKPLLMLSLDDYFKSQSVTTLKNLYEAINSTDLTHMPTFNAYERRILSACSESDMFIEKFEQSDTQSMISSLDSKNKPIESPSSSHTSSSLSLSGNIASNTDGSQSLGSHQLSPVSTSSFSTFNFDFPSSKTTATRNQTHPQSRTSYHAVEPGPTTDHAHSSFNSVSTGPTSAGDRDREKPYYYIDLKSNGQRLITRNVTRDTHFYETRVNFNGMKIPVKVPTNFEPEEVGDFSMINLIQTMVGINQPFTVLHKELTIYGPYTPPLLVLIYGLLTQKRILFVGLNNPSGEVSERVLAACYLASGGILRSFTTNAFPYTDLSKADEVMSCPGYIAGVKNPAFGHHKEWWDIFIDLENNIMRISPDIPGGYSPDTNTVKEQGPEYTSSKMETTNSGGSGNSADKEKEKTNAFFAKSLACVTNNDDSNFVKKMKHMVEDHFSEVSVRTRCSEYIKKFVRIATSYEKYKYGKSMFWPSQTESGSELDVSSKEHQRRKASMDRHVTVPGHGYVWANDSQRVADFHIYEQVIEGWRQSLSYQCYVEDCRREWPLWPKLAVDYEYHIDLLHTESLGPNVAAQEYFILADNIQDDDDISHFIATAGSISTSSSASSNNLLYYVALGMLHPRPEVRDAVIGLMWRIHNHSAGRHFFAKLNPFFLITYNRLLPQFISENGLMHPTISTGPRSSAQTTASSQYPGQQHTNLSSSPYNPPHRHQNSNAASTGLGLSMKPAHSGSESIADSSFRSSLEGSSTTSQYLSSGTISDRMAHHHISSPTNDQGQAREEFGLLS